MSSTVRRMFFVHWNEAEAQPRLAQMKRRGFEIEWSNLSRGTSSEDYRRLRESPPALIVIDLTRLPSHGKAVGIVLRQSKNTFFIPIVYVGGASEKVATVRERMPDAIYCEWDDVQAAIERALTHPPLPIRQLAEESPSKPLATKLGIREDSHVLLCGPPADFASSLGDLPAGVKLVTSKPGTFAKGTFQVIVFFTKERRALETALEPLESRLARHGGLWIAWPKKASKVPTTVTEDVVREVALPRGLVDNKVCAIDAIWSGLRLARRQKHGE